MDFEHVPFGRRVRHVLAGRVACCHCGHWASPIGQKVLGRWRRRWYCESCGGLVEVPSGRVLSEIFALLLVFMFTSPLAGNIPRWLFDMGPDSYIEIRLIGWLAICAVSFSLLRAGLLYRTMTRPVKPHGHCFGCGYNLNYSVSVRCSECGAYVRPIIVAIATWNQSSAQG